MAHFPARPRPILPGPKKPLTLTCRRVPPAATTVAKPDKGRNVKTPSGRQKLVEIPLQGGYTVLEQAERNPDGRHSSRIILDEDKEPQKAKEGACSSKAAAGAQSEGTPATAPNHTSATGANRTARGNQTGEA